MANVYVVMHDGEGNFMIAVKNKKGYFFHTDPVGGSIVPAGQNLRGGGLYALPGGGLEGYPVPGGLKEFYEETGTKLAVNQAKPGYYTGPDSEYYGIYFNVGSNFTPLLASIRMNLELGRQAAQAVIAGKFGPYQYPQLMLTYPGCPADNELYDATQWNLCNNIADINALAAGNATSWFFQILANLAMLTYGVIVKDAAGRLAGIGGAFAIEAGPVFIIQNFTPDPARLLPAGKYSFFTTGGFYKDLNFISIDGGVAIFKGV